LLHPVLSPYDHEWVSKADITGKCFSQTILVTLLFLDLHLDNILYINAPIWGYNFIEKPHVAVLRAKQSLDVFVEYLIQSFRTLQRLEILEAPSLPVVSHNRRLIYVLSYCKSLFLLKSIKELGDQLAKFLKGFTVSYVVQTSSREPIRRAM